MVAKIMALLMLAGCFISVALGAAGYLSAQNSIHTSTLEETEQAMAIATDLVVVRSACALSFLILAGMFGAAAEIRDELVRLRTIMVMRLR